jgi:hypothetical protein
MKRNLLIAFIFCSFNVSAQISRPLSNAFSAGLELGITSNSVYAIGLGASAKGEFPVSNRVCLTVTAGYSTFFYKSNLFASSRTLSPAYFIPLKAGIKYYPNPNVYIEGELGTAIETNYLKQDLFAFSIGPGFVVPINNNRGIDIGFRYEGWSDHQVRQTAIRFAYRW